MIIFVLLLGLVPPKSISRCFWCDTFLRDLRNLGVARLLVVLCLVLRRAMLPILHHDTGVAYIVVFLKYTDDLCVTFFMSVA